MTPQGSNRLGKEEFLKLLTTQLANQNPLEPVDNQAFIAQLAQFATVEQQSQMNSTLESLLVAQASTNQTAVANLVGKGVSFKSNQISLGAMGDTAITGRIAEDAVKVSAIITDKNGRVVRSIVVNGNQDAGPISLNWDGMDAEGKRLPAGTYSVTLTAEDAKGQSVTAGAHGKGRVSAISFTEGVPQLIVNGVRVRLSDVLEVNEPNSTTTP